VITMQNSLSSAKIMFKVFSGFYTIITEVLYHGHGIINTIIHP